MPSIKFPEEAHFIPSKELQEHATISAAQHLEAKLPGVDTWVNAKVQREPTTIYDINGKPLFQDFAVKDKEQTAGYVRAAASKILGSPVIALELGERSWSFEAAVRKLTPMVRKSHPQVSFSAPKLVCYSYPKLGVMFEFTGADNKPSRLIFDVASLEPIPEQGREGQAGKEGAYAWSFYETLDDTRRSAALKRYVKYDQGRAEIPATIQRQITGVRPLKAALEAIGLTPVLLKPLVKQLQFCNHPGTGSTRSHHCFALKGQQKDDYCAVATCQMILCYYRYYFSQDDIAPKLGYSSGGGCPADQSAGYEQLTHEHLDATFDNSPTWEKARDQINALHPLKSGIPGHARACAGYSSVRTLSGFIGGKPVFKITDKKLYIYDPWPWNADSAKGGAVYWEDWDSITHTNFVYTQISTS